MSKKTLKIEVVTGVEGPSLYVNDTRVAGNKPWGGGQVVYKFKVSTENLLEAIGKIKL